MKSSKKAGPIVVLLALCLALSTPMAMAAKEADSAVAACLKAWGDHPFGEHPQYKSLGASISVFGLGSLAGDTQPTSAPSLVLISPSLNLMGGSNMQLLNPNGWYCLETPVSIMGGMTIRAHCKAKLAATSNGRTVRGYENGNRRIKNIAVTMIGSVSVERPCD
jgi:hypothetical protein